MQGSCSGDGTGRGVNVCAVDTHLHLLRNKLKNMPLPKTLVKCFGSRRYIMRNYAVLNATLLRCVGSGEAPCRFATIVGFRVIVYAAPVTVPYHSKRIFVLLSCSSGREFMPTRVQLNLSARAKRREINVVPAVLNNGGGPFHLCSSQVQYRGNMMFEAFVVGT